MMNPMKERKPHQLKEGCVLDERYVIGDVLGEGGFGTTYAAVNRRTGAHYAVKEFFCRDFMMRSAAETSEISLTDDSEKEHYRTEKARFMREARTLRDFASLEGIVHVHECFEDNRTAYIVMELLDGKTLKKYVEEEGPIAIEPAIRLLTPLIQSLDRIHKAGVIHRDISPDNIMVRGDGTLTLMDFGAAREYSARTVSHSLIYKDGFAAKEQFDRRGKLGPWTDVYSTCATIYYMITGSPPEDAIQRVLHDELKTPSDLGVSIRPEVEAVLIKGLSMKPEARYQSVGELLDAFLKYYPVRTPEEEIRHQRRRTLAVTLAGILAAVFFLAGYVYYKGHEVEIRFRDMETETVWLYHHDMSDEEYREGARLLKARVEAFAGKRNYLWKESADSIRLTFPSELLGDKTCEYLLSAYVIRPLNMTMRAQYGDEKCSITLSPEDLEGIESCRGILPFVETSRFRLPDGDYTYYQFTLSEDKIRDIRDRSEELYQNIFLAEGGPVSLYFDYPEFFERAYYLNAFADGDGKTLYIVDYDQAEPFIRLTEHDLMTEPLPKGFTYIRQLKVRWEKPESSLMAGANQKNAADLAGPTVLATYPVSVWGKGRWYGAIASFKERMDAAGIPYAFGVLTDSEHTIAVRIPLKNANGTELSFLGLSNQYALYTDRGDALIYLSTQTQELSKEEEGNGGWNLCVSLSDYQKMSLKDALDKLEGENIRSVRLGLTSRLPVAEIPVEDAYAGADSGEMHFQKLLVGEEEEMKADNSRLGDFLVAMYREIPVTGTELGSVTILSEDNEPLPEESIGDAPWSRRESAAEEAVSTAKEYGFGTGSYDSEQDILTLTSRTEEADPYPEDLEARITGLIREADLGSGKFGTVRLNCLFADELSSRAQIILQLDTYGENAGKVSIYAYCYDLPDALYDALEQTFSEDPVLKEMPRRMYRY